MPVIPQSVAREYFTGLPLLQRGKVRDTYGDLCDCAYTLPVATDRINAFDFVLNAEIPDKGAVLTAMNVFWRIGPLPVGSWRKTRPRRLREWY